MIVPLKWIDTSGYKNSYFEQEQSNSLKWNYFEGKTLTAKFTQVKSESDAFGYPVVVLMEMGNEYVYKLVEGFTYMGTNLTNIEMEYFKGRWAKRNGK